MKSVFGPVRVQGAVVGLVALALLTAMAVHAAAQDGTGGSGSLEGSETDEQDEELVENGTLCFETQRSVYALRGEGTYHGLVDGDPNGAVYQAEVGTGEDLHDAGPLQLEVENLNTYYHGPNGTHGEDGGCSSESLGDPVAAEFRLFAEGHVHDGTGEPCTGEGEFWRDAETFGAQWTLGEDCVVEGNEAGTPGTGTAPAGTVHTHEGAHEPDFGGTTPDNIRIDYEQRLVSAGLSLQGPASAELGEEAAVVATLLEDDFTPVSGTDVEFTVDGPGEVTPASGDAQTGEDGEAAFAFTADAVGSYEVTATATHEGEEQSATHTVEFVEPGLRLALDGPTTGQVGEDVTLEATVTDAGEPVSGTDVDFAIAAGPGPTSGGETVATGEDGTAEFTFDVDAEGTYAVRATTTHEGESASAIHGVEFSGAAAACPEDEVPEADFTDRAAIPSAHRFNVDCASWREIVAGFQDGSYGPTLQVRRDQMASFIARTLDAADVDLPSASGDRFDDVAAGSTHDEAIHRLAAADIVSGGPGALPADSYGPGLQVRRDQMASFMLRAAEFATDQDLASQEQAFSDVPSGNAHFANVNGAAEVDLARGFGDNTYRPASDVRRDQMGTFVIRLFTGLWEDAFEQGG